MVRSNLPPINNFSKLEKQLVENGFPKPEYEYTVLPRESKKDDFLTHGQKSAHNTSEGLAILQ